MEDGMDGNMIHWSSSREAREPKPRRLIKLPVTCNRTVFMYFAKAFEFLDAVDP